MQLLKQNRREIVRQNNFDCSFSCFYVFSYFYNINKRQKDKRVVLRIKLVYVLMNDI